MPFRSAEWGRSKGTGRRIFPSAPRTLPLCIFSMPNSPFLLTYTRGECATLVLWFRVELAIKLNKTANGV